MKKLQQLIKTVKNYKKYILHITNITYYTYYILLLITQDLWQAHYQIFSLTFLKEFIELNVNTDTIKKM